MRLIVLAVLLALLSGCATSKQREQDRLLRDVQIHHVR